MPATVAPVPRQTFFANDGMPAAGGFLYTYAAGTTTPLTTYSNQALSVAISNPICLNSAGRPQASALDSTEVNIYLSAANYKFLLTNSVGTTLWTSDNVYAVQSAVLPATFTVGSVLYANTTSTVAGLADVAAGSVLASGGLNTAPAYTANPSVTTITTTGKLIGGTGVDISGASAGQIVFPATQNPSSNTRTLDDYREFTWTPVIGGVGGTSGQVYTAQEGRGVKIGSLVWASCYVVLATKGTITGGVQIQGLPFTAETGVLQFYMGSIQWINLATTWVSLIAYANQNTTTIAITGTTVAAVSNNVGLSTADITNTTGFSAMVIYRAAA